jgi:hypothetical protein
MSNILTLVNDISARVMTDGGRFGVHKWGWMKYVSWIMGRLRFAGGKERRFFVRMAACQIRNVRQLKQSFFLVQGRRWK